MNVLSRVLCAPACWPALLSAAPLLAIVIRHDRPEEPYRAIARDYPAAVDVGSDGGGVLIDPRWVLTAAHVVQGVGPFDARVTIGASHHSEGGRTVAIDRVILHPGFRLGANYIENDIALVRLADPVEDVEPVPLYTKTDEAGKEVVLVGNGGFGNGETGATEEDRIRRGATNRVARVEQSTLHFRFDGPGEGTELEGFWGPGDSGTPVFLNDGGETFLVGVASSGDDSNSNGIQPDYGDQDLSFRVSHYAEWIRDEMAQNAEASAQWSTPIALGGADELDEFAAETLAEYRDARLSHDEEMRRFFLKGRFTEDCAAADPKNRAARAAMWRDEELPFPIRDAAVVGYAECHNGGFAVLLKTPVLDEYLALTFLAEGPEPQRLTEVRFVPVPSRFFKRE